MASDVPEERDECHVVTTVKGFRSSAEEQN